MTFKETTKSILQVFKDNAKITSKDFLPFLMPSAAPLLALFLIPTTISWFFLAVGSDAIQAGADTTMIAKIIFGGVLDMIVGLALTLYVTSRYAETNYLTNYQNRDFHKKPLTTYKFLLIEELRSYLPILVKSLLLLIPGMIEALKLYFVSYVVIFDEAYEKGELDALREAVKLPKVTKNISRFFF